MREEIFNSELDGKKSLLMTACGSIFMIILGIVLHFFVKVKVQGAVNEFLLSIIPVEMFLGGYLGVNHLFNYKDKRVVTVGGAVNISILLAIANMNVNGFVYVFSRLLALIIIVLVIYSVRKLFVTIISFSVFQFIVVLSIYYISKINPKVISIVGSEGATLYVALVSGFIIYLFIAVKINNYIYFRFIGGDKEKIKYSDIKKHMIVIGCGVFIAFNIHILNVDAENNIYALVNNVFLTYTAILSLDNILEIEDIKRLFKKLISL